MNSTPSNGLLILYQTEGGQTQKEGARQVDLKEARELIVYAVREYLSDINNNEEIRPYLHNYPFTAKNVEIRIFIYGPDRRELPSEKIYYISAI